MTTVTTKAKAYITDLSSVGPQDILKGKRLSDLTFHEGKADMTQYGWTLVGEAEITVYLVDEESMVKNKVAALRKEAENIRAEATARVTHIESQIQNLLAISYDAPEAA